MSVKVRIGFALVVFSAMVAVVWYSVHTGNEDLLNFGTFVTLTLTLIVLFAYAYDTNSIARVTREQWKRLSVLNSSYEMVISDEKGQRGHTLFRIHNPSTLVIRAKVRCNFRLYGERVDYPPSYDGTETWYVFPQQTSQGWFEVERLLQKKGKSVAQLVTEQTEGNRTEQLTMDLKLEFRDELGESRVLPPRRVYFDFEKWRWIPVLTQQDDWV